MTDHAEWAVRVYDADNAIAELTRQAARIAELEGEVSDAMKLIQFNDAEIFRLLTENERLREGLRTFAAAVYNDNGDVTISTAHLRTGDYMKARALLSDTGETPSA